MITQNQLPPEVEIIGISFRGAGKVYYFAANGHTAAVGDHAIVETARGMEYGDVTIGNTFVKRESLVMPLKSILRMADKNDDLRFEANREKEKDAFDICQKKILEHKLNMKLVDVEYTFDNSKLLFYFTSDDRVDFRELVKDLAGYFRTRIELRQIGIRDEAKLIGGLGICGRPFCCSTFLPDFVQVSIKMAKEQNLSLNASKISGSCGRLMCCLRYEYDTYQEEMRKMPKVDAVMMTPDGPGTVTEIRPLDNTVKIMLSDGSEKTPKLYHISVIAPYDKNAADKNAAVTQQVSPVLERSADSSPAPVKEESRPKQPKDHGEAIDRTKMSEPVQEKTATQEGEQVLGDEEMTAAEQEDGRRSRSHHRRRRVNRGKDGRSEEARTDPNEKVRTDTESATSTNQHQGQSNRRDRENMSNGGRERQRQRKRRATSGSSTAEENNVQRASRNGVVDGTPVGRRHPSAPAASFNEKGKDSSGGRRRRHGHGRGPEKQEKGSDPSNNH